MVPRRFSDCSSAAAPRSSGKGQRNLAGLGQRDRRKHAPLRRKLLRGLQCRLLCRHTNRACPRQHQPRKGRAHNYSLNSLGKNHTSRQCTIRGAKLPHVSRLVHRRPYPPAPHRPALRRGLQHAGDDRRRPLHYAAAGDRRGGLPALGMGLGAGRGHRRRRRAGLGRTGRGLPARRRLLCFSARDLRPGARRQMAQLSLRLAGQLHRAAGHRLRLHRPIELSRLVLAGTGPRSLRRPAHAPLHQLRRRRCLPAGHGAALSQSEFHHAAGLGALCRSAGGHRRSHRLRLCTTAGRCPPRPRCL